MAVHTIRLRAPWKWEREDDRQAWRRAFGRPSNLTERETVRLVLQSESASAQATLNGKVLGPAPAAYDVTDAIGQRNTLTLSMACTGQAEGGRAPPFDVRLEIDSEADA